MGTVLFPKPPARLAALWHSLGGCSGQPSVPALQLCFQLLLCSSRRPALLRLPASPEGHGGCPASRLQVMGHIQATPESSPPEGGGRGGWRGA